MDPVIQLTGARVALDAARSERIDLRIHRGRILPFDTGVAPTHQIDLSGHLLLPGLINAHDHLEFGLFPRLGHGPWPNAREWAASIHRPCESPVKEHRAVPRAARLNWGALRNLLCGVTTVVHHNPLEPELKRRSFPVRVLHRIGWAHSLDFSPDAVEQRLKTPVGWPFIIHAAEGIDERAHRELDSLDELGILDCDTVLVHATGATQPQLARARAVRASIVWCPSSNLFMFGRSLCPSTVRTFPNLCLGTDSSLTADGDLIDEISRARRWAAVEPADLYPLLTSNPARIFRLDNGSGAVQENGIADLIAVRDRGQNPAEALTDLPPEFVLNEGRPVLVSARFCAMTNGLSTAGMQWLEVEGRGRFLARAPIAHLISAATTALGTEFRLGGKRVSQ